MAADYSKAGDPQEERLAAARQAMCGHPDTERSMLSGRVWCLSCGADLSLIRRTSEPIDTSELGPIKLDYETAVSDARVLNWRPIPHAGALPMPLDKPFYAAWRVRPWGSPAGEVHWHVERVEVGKPCPALAQWWADDLLGLPPCND